MNVTLLDFKASKSFSSPSTARVNTLGLVLRMGKCKLLQQFAPDVADYLVQTQNVPLD